MVWTVQPSSEATALTSDLGRKYLWWTPIGDEPHSLARQIAQVMNLGGYDDILRLESALDRATLIDVMHRAQPGWFTPRSWEFWRGRLELAGIIAPETPRRILPLASPP